MYVPLLRSLFSHLFCDRSLLDILLETYCKITYHAKLNLPTAHVNDCSKVIVHELVRSLKLICLGLYMDFLDELDQWITDLLLRANRPKHLTYKY